MRWFLSGIGLAVVFLLAFALAWLRADRGGAEPRSPGDLYTSANR